MSGNDREDWRYTPKRKSDMTDIVNEQEKAYSQRIRIAELEDALQGLVKDVDDDFMYVSGVCGWHDKGSETQCAACRAREILKNPL